MGERALGQADFLDVHRSDFRCPLADEVLDEFLPAGVLHPPERDVRREVVFFRLEAEFGRFALDGVVERGEFDCTLRHAQPEHRDVVHAREDAEAFEFGVEGGDARGRDGALARRDDVVVFVLRDVAEELQRHVGLCGVDEVEPVRALELRL